MSVCPCTVLAALTLALLITPNPTPEAQTVVFLAPTFLAVTAPFVDLGQTSVLCDLIEHPRLESGRILVQPALNNVVPELLVDLLVLAGDADTVNSAKLTAFEALAVHLQTLRLLAFTGKLLGVAVSESLSTREEHDRLMDFLGLQLVPRIAKVAYKFGLPFFVRAQKKSFFIGWDIRGHVKKVIAFKKLLGRF